MLVVDSKPPSQLRISIVLVVAAGAWGLYWLPLRAAAEAGLGQAWAVVLLSIAPAPLLLLYTFVKRADLRGTWRQTLIAGGLVGAGFALYGLALVYTSVIRATLLFYLMPIWGTVIGAVFLRERVSWRRWAAIAMGLGGLSLMLGVDANSAASSSAKSLNIGDAFALISSLLWAAASAYLLGKRHLQLHATLTMQYLGGGVLCICIALALEPQLPSIATFLELAPMALLVTCGLIVPSLFFCLWCSQRIAPGRVGLLMMSEVLVAVISAAFLLPQEALSSTEWLGGVVIVGAAAIEISTKTASS